MANHMKLDIHQYVAFWWVMGAAFVFAPVVAASTRADGGPLIAQGILLVTVCIAACPLLLRWRLFRSLFCWTDALSVEQRTALTRRDIQQYYRLTANDGYVRRVKPYLLRILVVEAILDVMSAAMPDSVWSVFGTWYPLGVLILAMSSLPWPSFMARRKR
jgi:hypothetical protein